LKRKTRWELLFFDTLIYLISALFILVLYPSSIYKLSMLQLCAYTLAGWLCVTVSRFAFHLYQKIWRYAGPMEYISLIAADGLATIVFLLLRAFIPNSITFVRAIALMMSNLLGCIMIRMLYQWVYLRRARTSRLEKSALFLLKLVTGSTFADEKSNTNRIKIAIVGAGSVGAMLADELIQNPRAIYEPVCFVDVDKQKTGREVFNLPVLNSTDDLRNRLQRYGVQEVVFPCYNVAINEKTPCFCVKWE